MTAWRNGGRDADELGKLELARFNAPEDLNSLGDGLYQATERSGDPVQGRPGEDGLGLYAQGHLESSNVQLNEEIVNLMVAQRAYEANAKVVQASDDMLGLNEAAQIKSHWRCLTRQRERQGDRQHEDHQHAGACWNRELRKDRRERQHGGDPDRYQGGNREEGVINGRHGVLSEAPARRAAAWLHTASRCAASTGRKPPWRPPPPRSSG